MTVTEYLAKIPGTDDFLALDQTEQDKWTFQAEESLKDHLHPRQITERVIALQTIYMYEGQTEDFAVLKRQGVDQFSTEGMSISFKSGTVAPQVIEIVQKSNRASVGSII